MAFETERENIAQVVDKHGSAPLSPEFSAPVARSIVRHSIQLKINPPLVISRFMDRAEGPKGANGALDKLSRDFHGKDYADLPADKQADMDSRHSSLAMSNPATGHPYLKPGLTFAQGHNLLIAAFSEEKSSRFPQTIRAALSDFSKALEKDLDEAAKHPGFFKEYSDANMALKVATAGPHRAGQAIPIKAAARR
jgi:hypothetical protein